MMNDNQILHFTRKERMGMIVMMAIILLLHMGSFVHEKWFAGSIKTDKEVLQRFLAFTSAIDTTNVYDYNPGYAKVAVDKKENSTLFFFNPNTLSEEGWVKLGVKQKTAQTILKYISKGGRFYAAEDLRKIWGLQQDATRLMPFVRIEMEHKATEKKINFTEQQNFQKVDINMADSLAWLSLPGIGPSLTKRILSFRQRLGGFYSIQQVSETYGLADSIFQKIQNRLVLQNILVKKMDINAVGLDELKSHPYIRYALANAMIQYRQQHGKFQRTTDLKKIMLITDSMYNKMIPYLMAN